MKKILIYRNSNLGDFLITIPILRKLRQKFPGCNITFMTIKNKRNFFLPKNIENKILVDDFLLFKKEDYKNFFQSIKLINKIKKKKFDTFIYLQEFSSFPRIFRDYIFFIFSFIPNKIGFSNYFLYRNYKKFSETIYLFKRVFDKSSVSEIKKLMFFKNEINNRIIKKKIYITISPGSISAPEKWNDKNWLKLVNLIKKKYNHINIILTGTLSENKICNKIKKKFNYRIINLCNKTSIEELFNIIKHTRVHICQDNGSMHVASLYRKKNISIFNNHDPFGKWFPLNKKSKIISVNRSINFIKPEMVFKLFKDIY